MADSYQQVLDDAVATFLNSPGWRGEPGVLTGYILVAAEAMPSTDESDGNTTTGYSYISLGGGLPLHVCIGLLRTALVKYEAEAASD